MKTWQKIFLTVVIGGLVLKPKQKTITTGGGTAGGGYDPPLPGSKFRSPLTPLVIRNDSQGHGHFGARRAGGLRSHKGIDLICYEGQTVYCPIYGYVNRVSRPYANDTNYIGCEITGTGKHSGYKIKIWYMTPIRVGEDVIPGSHLGSAQAISRKYGGGMKDHIHLQLYHNGQVINPTPLFNFPIA